MKTQEEKQTELSKRSEVNRVKQYEGRFKQYLEFSGIPVEDLFDEKVGVNVRVSTLLMIFDCFPELNPTWLLTGRGNMIQSVSIQNSVHEAVNTVLDANKGAAIVIDRLSDGINIEIPDLDNSESLQKAVTELEKQFLEVIQVSHLQK